MNITDREVTRAELDAIYKDFKVIERRDGVPDAPQIRLQYVAEEDGRMVGLASGLTNHKWFSLTDLWVHEDCRRRGLGARLLRLLEEKAASAGAEHVYLWTSGPVNPVFYEKQGYQAFAVFEDYYEVPGYHRVGYRKDL